MKKSVRNPYADDIQAAIYKNFPPDNFLGEKSHVDHFIQWVTFFRRNLHRFATDYLGIKLYPYQAEMLYLMGTGEFIVIIASRASAKSFITALYCCCRCILYPNSKIVLAAGTKGQSKLLVSEKIQKELMSMSPPLRKEIRNQTQRPGRMTGARFYSAGSHLQGGHIGPCAGIYWDSLHSLEVPT